MEKSYIISEIKRTATSGNAGRPLGWRRFRTETGIQQSDWFPHYWTRWNEAIKEAGYTPNQLSRAYARGDLLERYADLALEIHRLPTNADLRAKAHRSPGFPNDKVFTNMGKKAAFVEELARHCSGRSEYEDVLGWCREYRPRQEDRPDGVTAVGDTVFGFVYLMKSGRFYKIGKTNAAGRRERELAIQLPEQTKTVHVIRTDDPSGIEAYWHRRFESKRRNGEWFELDASDVAAFKRRKLM
jgi:hypothetical protein